MENNMDYSNTSIEFDLWFGLSGPMFLITMIGLYLLFVLSIGPKHGILRFEPQKSLNFNVLKFSTQILDFVAARDIPRLLIRDFQERVHYMKNRPAYKLKTFITFYNVAQVLACVYLIKESINVASTDLFRFWKCSLFDKNTRAEYLFNRLTYFAFWLKLVEFSETIVFVLRKKQNQVSFLHVFHHCTTVSLVYILARYYRGGAALYPLFLNSNVHIVMYSYYLASALCDQKVVQRLLPIKKSITTIQMIQFVMILLQVAVMAMNCDIPKPLIMYYSSVIGVIFYGFYDFYKKSYTSKQVKS